MKMTTPRIAALCGALLATNQILAYAASCKPQNAGPGGFGYSLVDCSAGNGNANCAGSGVYNPAYPGGTPGAPNGNGQNCFNTRYTAGTYCSSSGNIFCTCNTTWVPIQGQYQNGACGGQTQSCVCNGANQPWLPTPNGTNQPNCTGLTCRY